MSDSQSYGNYPVHVGSPRVRGAGAEVGDGARVRAGSLVGAGETLVPRSVLHGEWVGRQP
jgi:carbonic anhydrase/acetyltransferase-like protein (isoleucine patch superfamily)